MSVEVVRRCKTFVEFRCPLLQKIICQAVDAALSAKQAIVKLCQRRSEFFDHSIATIRDGLLGRI